MEINQVIQALLALGQVNRLGVFRLIVEHGATGIRPLEISEALGIPGATLSFHLKELSAADLVSVRREGRNLIYRPRPETIEGVMGFLLQNCCGGKGCGDGGDAHSPQKRRSRARES